MAAIILALIIYIGYIVFKGSYSKTNESNKIFYIIGAVVFFIIALIAYN